MGKKYIKLTQGCLQGLLLSKSDLSSYFSSNAWGDLLELSDVIKEDTDRSILQFTLPTGTRVFGKIYKEAGFKNFIRRFFFGARARQSHFRTLSFIGHAVTTPDSLGYLVRKLGAFNVESIHFCEFLNDGKSLAEVLADINFKNAERQHLLVDIARLFSELHRVGYIHGDAKLTNILSSNQKLYFVDLDGVRRRTFIAGPERDVARFLVGLSELQCGEKSDREKFYASYCALSSVDEIQFTKRVMALVTKFQSRHQLKYGLKPVDIF